MIQKGFRLSKNIVPIEYDIELRPDLDNFTFYGVETITLSVLKATKEVQVLKDQNRLMSMEYARLTRPEHVRKYAMSRLTLNDAKNGQIIQLTGQKIALPQ